MLSQLPYLHNLPKLFILTVILCLILLVALFSHKILTNRNKKFDGYLNKPINHPDGLISFNFDKLTNLLYPLLSKGSKSVDYLTSGQYYQIVHRSQNRVISASNSNYNSQLVSRKSNGSRDDKTIFLWQNGYLINYYSGAYFGYSGNDSMKTPFKLIQKDLLPGQFTYSADSGYLYVGDRQIGLHRNRVIPSVSGTDQWDFYLVKPRTPPSIFKHLSARVRVNRRLRLRNAYNRRYISISNGNLRLTSSRSRSKLFSFTSNGALSITGSLITPYIRTDTRIGRRVKMKADSSDQYKHQIWYRDGQIINFNGQVLAVKGRSIIWDEPRELASYQRWVF